MPPRRDIPIGTRFGHWVVVGPRVSRPGSPFYPVRCDCGADGRATGTDLRAGRTTRCLKCGHRARSRVGTLPTHGHTRGKRPTPEYRSWCSMHERCENPRTPCFPQYGGRGIRIAEEWRGVGGFERFLAHIGPRPSLKHSIDRIDPNGHYEPGNVRWATMAEQQRNRTNNVEITIGGETLCVADWAQRVGIKANTIYARIRKGWEPARAVTTPLPAKRAAA